MLKVSCLLPIIYHSVNRAVRVIILVKGLGPKVRLTISKVHLYGVAYEDFGDILSGKYVTLAIR